MRVNPSVEGFENLVMVWSNDDNIYPEYFKIRQILEMMKISKNRISTKTSKH